MSKDIVLADAISALPNGPATVLLPAQDLAAILAEIRTLKADFDRFKKVHKEFAIRTANEIDELFFRVNKQPTAPGKKQAARLNKLEALLIARGNEALTFSEAGKYLELGSRSGKTSTRRQNMTRLGKIIANDGRFCVFDSNTQKGAKMIALDKDYFSRGPPKV
jgi:hypothetical protein